MHVPFLDGGKKEQQPPPCFFTTEPGDVDEDACMHERDELVGSCSRPLARGNQEPELRKTRNYSSYLSFLLKCSSPFHVTLPPCFMAVPHALTMTLIFLDPSFH